MKTKEKLESIGMPTYVLALSTCKAGLNLD